MARSLLGAASPDLISLAPRGRCVVREDRPEVRGMIRTADHVATVCAPTQRQGLVTQALVELCVEIEC